MKYEKYKQLTKEEKEEYNFRFKDKNYSFSFELVPSLLTIFYGTTICAMLTLTNESLSKYFKGLLVLTDRLFIAFGVLILVGLLLQFYFLGVENQFLKQCTYRREKNGKYRTSK